MKKAKQVLSIFLTVLTLGMTVAVCILQVGAVSIPADAVNFNGHYYVVVNESKKWTEAEAECEQSGGHLATITTEEEQQFINRFIENQTMNTYWIGASKTSQGWKWVTDEAFSFTNWKKDEPNNERGQEKYLEIYCKTYNSTTNVGQWNDIMIDGRNGYLDKSFYSTTTIGYICEWEPCVDGHTWDQGTEIVSPTCTENGTIQYTCTVCNATEAKPIDALGHTAPDEKGNCVRCNAHISDVEQPSSQQLLPVNFCKYCGKEHTGFFGMIIGFFHSILALFGLHK